MNLLRPLIGGLLGGRVRAPSQYVCTMTLGELGSFEQKWRWMSIFQNGLLVVLLETTIMNI